MKFLFLSSHAHFALDPSATKVSGGAELQIALLAKELARHGHDVVIVGGDSGQPDNRTLQGVRTRVGGKFHTGGLVDTLRAVPTVFRILREEQPDYAGILGWTTWLFLLLCFKPWCRYALVFICGLDTEVNGEFRRENPVRGALFEYAVRHSDVRFAMTDYQKSQFELSGQTCGLYRNLILQRRAPRSVKKDIDFLWVARCRTFKRPGVFLDLAEKFPSARCTMVCPNEDEGLWKAVSARAQRLANVQFFERVPYHEIQDYYDRAAVFVNTSEYEGFANSFIQAGLGEAAILSLEVNSDTVLTRYEVGLCADGEVDRFYGHAETLLRDAAMRQRLQQQAAKFVAELHDNDANVAAFLAGLPKVKGADAASV
jgi:glycosyltransferase involved in cell wall biosynthesis